MNNKSLKYALLIVTFLTVLGLSAEEARKVNFAVLGLKNGTGVTSGETDILADRLRVNLFRTGKVVMMERSQMDEILKEQGFQASGACNDAECAVEMGQMLGVERVVSGSIGKLGNLFLVNLRVIDVQTAKILMVVSKDISGGIEGVVKVLPGLAEDLVKDPKGSGAPVTVKPVPPVIKEEPEKVEPQPTQKVVEETDSKDDSFTARTPGKKSRKGKNKNRGGVKLSVSLLPGATDVFFQSSDLYHTDFKEWDFINEEYLDFPDSYGLKNDKATEKHFRANLNFIIPIWKYIAIDVGPGFSYLKRSVEYTLESYYVDTLWSIYVPADEEIKLQIFSPNISAGLNFVYRLHPLKINAGFIVDLNFNILRYKYLVDYSSYSSQFDDLDKKRVAFETSFSFGPKIGVEILAGKKVGFSFDYTFKYNKIETTKMDIYSDTNNESWRFILPKHALSFGMNFYKD